MTGRVASARNHAVWARWGRSLGAKELIAATETSIRREELNDEEVSGCRGGFGSARGRTGQMNADTILFSNLGTNNSFDTTNGWLVEGSNFHAAGNRPAVYA